MNNFNRSLIELSSELAKELYDILDIRTNYQESISGFDCVKNFSINVSDHTS